MKTILLAAGHSKRVKPIPDKCFVRICGKYLIEWQLEALAKAGFYDVIVVGNRDNIEMLNDQLPATNDQRIVVVEQEDLDAGMKGAMNAVKELVLGEKEIMVVSSNDFVADGLWSTVKSLLDEEIESDGFLVGYKVSEYFPGGYLKIGEDDFVNSIVEKPGEGNEPSDLINLVIHVHRDVKSLYLALESVQSYQDDVYEVALQKLFDEQKKYSVLSYDGFWQSVKYPWHLLDLTECFLGKLKRNISNTAQIADTAVINGEVVIEDGVRVFDHAVINGPAYIGKDSIVANFAMIRQSSIGRKCVVGSYTEVARSILQDEVWTHKNYIGDSIIGNNVSFGSGTVTGNLRLDEGDISSMVQGEKLSSGRNKYGLVTGDNIRVGINTSFMPAVIVGSNSQIGAHLFVAQDIPENAYVKSLGGGGLDISENRGKVNRR